MKKTVAYASVISIMISGLFLSCSKKSTDPAPSSQSSLNGKWEATGVYVFLYDSIGNFINVQGISRTFQHAGIVPWVDSFTTYATFNSNNTYSMTHRDGTPGGTVLETLMPTKGTWQLKDSNAILNLSVFTATGNLDFKVIDFTNSHVEIVDSETYSDHLIHATHIEFAK